jgi:hypothetical protein
LLALVVLGSLLHVPALTARRAGLEELAGLAGWRLERARVFERPEGPPIRRTFWRRGEGDTILVVELVECPSRREAHTVLRDLVGEYQSPEVGRDERSDVGDVAFGVPGATAVAFARANVVAQVRNASGEVVPVGEVASAVDDSLHRRPEIGGAAVPSIEGPVLRRTELRPGETAELILKAADPLGSPVTLRYYSRLGEVAVVDGVAVYQAAEPGKDQLVVIATTPGGSAEATADIVVTP